MEPASPVRGRGAASNPANRFAALRYEVIEGLADESPAVAAGEDSPAPLPRTQFLRDASQSLITRNDSPDIGFEASINPYRGCEHGCIYCYARPYHEYLGFSAGLDFETKILVKTDAPALLRRELAAPGYRPTPLALSGVTDPYQPVERRLRLTRDCLEVLAECRHPVAIVTKNHLVTRDADLLGELARYNAAVVHVTIVTLDAELARVLEPRTSTPATRLEAIRLLRAAGVPVGVLIAPVIPGLTDHELPAIVSAAAAAGAGFAGFSALRLPPPVDALFTEWLAQRFPDRQARVLAAIKELRGGRLNDPRFHARMRGEGPAADRLRQLYHVACRRAGIDRPAPELSTAHFRRPRTAQLELW